MHACGSTSWGWRVKITMRRITQILGAKLIASRYLIIVTQYNAKTNWHKHFDYSLTILAYWYVWTHNMIGFLINPWLCLGHGSRYQAEYTAITRAAIEQDVQQIHVVRHQAAGRGCSRECIRSVNCFCVCKYICIYNKCSSEGKKKKQQTKESELSFWLMCYETSTQWSIFDT